MPGFPLVDAHLHLWDLRRLSYPWLNAAPGINRNHLPEDYRRACGPVSVSKMVFVQCECDPAQFREECAWAGDMAASDPRIRGLVPWAPLELGAAAEETLASLTRDPRVKGIRRIIQFEPDPAFCLTKGFVAGVGLLPRYGLSFDLCIVHTQLPNTLKLVRACPEVRFVLDHVGKPSIRTGELEPWRRLVRELAAEPNVWCKLSGLATEADLEAWIPGQFRPYVDHVLEVFGFSRTMFGGDWPVCTQAVAFSRWVEVLDSIVAGSSDDELHRLYVGTAECFYRI